MHMPADLGENLTYEDYLEEARLTILFAILQNGRDLSIHAPVDMPVHPSYT